MGWWPASDVAPLIRVTATDDRGSTLSWRVRDVELRQLLRAFGCPVEVPSRMSRLKAGFRRTSGIQPADARLSSVCGAWPQHLGAAGRAGVVALLHGYEEYREFAVHNGWIKPGSPEQDAVRGESDVEQFFASARRAPTAELLPACVATALLSPGNRHLTLAGCVVVPMCRYHRFRSTGRVSLDLLHKHMLRDVESATDRGDLLTLLQALKVLAPAPVGAEGVDAEEEYIVPAMLPAAVPAGQAVVQWTDEWSPALLGDDAGATGGNIARRLFTLGARAGAWAVCFSVAALPCELTPRRCHAGLQLACFPSSKQHGRSSAATWCRASCAAARGSCCEVLPRAQARWQWWCAQRARTLHHTRL